MTAPTPGTRADSDGLAEVSDPLWYVVLESINGADWCEPTGTCNSCLAAHVSTAVRAYVAAHDRHVRAQAWDEGWVARMALAVEGEYTPNPYRADVEEADDG